MSLSFWKPDSEEDQNMMDRLSANLRKAKAAAAAKAKAAKAKAKANAKAKAAAKAKAKAKTEDRKRKNTASPPKPVDTKKRKVRETMLDDSSDDDEYVSASIFDSAKTDEADSSEADDSSDEEADPSSLPAVTTDADSSDDEASDDEAAASNNMELKKVSPVQAAVEAVETGDAHWLCIFYDTVSKPSFDLGDMETLNGAWSHVKEGIMISSADDEVDLTKLVTKMQEAMTIIGQKAFKYFPLYIEIHTAAHNKTQTNANAKSRKSPMSDKERRLKAALAVKKKRREKKAQKLSQLKKSIAEVMKRLCPNDVAAQNIATLIRLATLFGQKGVISASKLHEVLRVYDVHIDTSDHASFAMDFLKTVVFRKLEGGFTLPPDMLHSYDTEDEVKAWQSNNKTRLKRLFGKITYPFTVTLKDVPIVSDGEGRYSNSADAEAWVRCNLSSAITAIFKNLKIDGAKYCTGSEELCILLNIAQLDEELCCKVRLTTIFDSQ